MNIRLDNSDISSFRSTLTFFPSSPLRDGLVLLLSGLRISNGLVEINQKVLGPIGASLVVELGTTDGALLIDIKSAKAGVGSFSLGFFGVIRKAAGNTLLKYLNLPPFLKATKIDGNIRLYIAGLNISSCLISGEVMQLQALLE